MTENNSEKPAKKTKVKGPIRTEAVVPFLIVTVVTYVYFHFFFDLHLKKAVEFAGYQVMGAEVDVASIETSFLKGTFRMKGLQVTNAEKPQTNLIEIGDIRFGFLWDALLRAKFVVNEMAIEQIEIGTKRKAPGRVKPPEPIKADEPSALEREANKLKDKALNKVQDEYSGNILSDVASMLAGTSGQDQLAQVEGTLASKKRMKEFEGFIKERQTSWNERIKTLPQGKDIQALSDRLSKVKTKDFKSPQEFQESLQQVDAILKEADQKYKVTQQAGNDFKGDISSIEHGIKEIDALIKSDIKALEARFKIPRLDAKSISQSLFRQYLDPYLAKFNYYKGVAEKYIPPNLMKKGNPDEVDVSIKPHPRAAGVTYEFGRPNSYPLFWVKKVSVSSLAKGSPTGGDLKGSIQDITSNPALIGRPTIAQFAGDFPGLEIHKVATKLTIDNTKADSRIGFDFAVGSYPINGRDLIASGATKVGFKKAGGTLSTTGELVALRDFSFQLNNQVQNIDYDIGSDNQILLEVLQGVFADIPVVTMQASGKGVLPSLGLDVSSNLGGALQKGFEKQIQKKIDEARVKIQAYIDENISKEKQKIETQFNQLKAQFENEIKKVQDQLNSQKAQAESKVEQAKKESENQAKKSVEDQVKKALGPDGDKKVEDLKKKLGW